MKKIWQQEIKLPLFVTILSILNVLLYNIPFLQFIVNHAEMEGITRIILIISFIALLFTIIPLFLSMYHHHISHNDGRIDARKCI